MSESEKLDLIAQQIAITNQLLGKLVMVAGPLPGIVINVQSIGTTASSLYTRREGMVLDFMVQNLSANNLYILNEASQPVAQGIQITAGNYCSKDNWTGDLIVVADGAASDARVMLMIHPPPWSKPSISGGP